MADPYHSQIYVYPRYNQIYKFSNHSQNYHYSNFIIDQPLIFYFLIGGVGIVICLKCFCMCLHACSSLCRTEQEMRRSLDDDISVSEDTDQDEEDYTPPQPTRSAAVTIGDVQVNIISNTNNKENSEDENSEDLPTYSEIFSSSK